MDKDYFQKAMGSRTGILLVALQAAALVVGVMIFWHTVPWLMAHPISEIGNYERPSPPPPSWAHAFNVSHGTFHYFPEPPAENPLKAGGWIAAMVLLGGLEVVISRKIRRLPLPGSI